MLGQEDLDVSVVVVGIMQDGGLPHIGCQCPRCRAAFKDPTLACFAACLAIIDRRSGLSAVWMIDATPDIKWQLDMLAEELIPQEAQPHGQRKGRLRRPEGIFLTHAHMGHIGGLPQLGPEAMDVHDMPLYGTTALLSLLSQTDLWHPVISGLNLISISPGEPLILAPDLSITAVSVPHRDEWGVGTVAYRINGPRKSLFYLPDIDDWDLWPQANRELAEVDVAMVDASFFSAEELGGRTPVAHPLVPDTLGRFADIPAQLVLTHINHTNPILDSDSPERRKVLQAGVQIAYRGLTFSL